MLNGVPICAALRSPSTMRFESHMCLLDSVGLAKAVTVQFCVLLLDVSVKNRTENMT